MNSMSEWGKRAAAEAVAPKRCPCGALATVGVPRAACAEHAALLVLTVGLKR